MLWYCIVPTSPTFGSQVIGRNNLYDTWSYKYFWCGLGTLVQCCSTNDIGMCIDEKMSVQPDGINSPEDQCAGYTVDTGCDDGCPTPGDNGCPCGMVPTYSNLLTCSEGSNNCSAPVTGCTNDLGPVFTPLNLEPFPDPLPEPLPLDTIHRPELPDRR